MSNPNISKPDFIRYLSELERFFPIIILAFTLPLFFYNLGGVAFLGPDEPRYAQVAREMYERNDFVTPTLLQDTWFEKPALLYWLMIGFYHLLSPSELAARLPNALFATSNLLIIYYIAKKASSAMHGLFSSLILATSGLYFGLARAASFDMPLTFGFTTSIAAFYLADISENKKSKLNYLILFYACVGISVLAKGLVGLVLIAAIIGLYIIITGQMRNLFQLQPFLGFFIFLAVISLWYLPVTLKHGWLFIDEFFVQHHFQRFTSNKYHHPGPIYFFVLVILGGTFPWSIFLLKALKSAFRVRPSSFSWFANLDKQGRLLLLATLWVFIPLDFFSLSTSKLPGYILPVFPALALIIGFEVKKAFEEWKELQIPALITGILILLVSFISPYFAIKELKVSSSIYWVLAPAIVFISLVITISLWRKQRYLTFIGIFGFSPVLTILVTTNLFPALENKDSLAPLMQVVATTQNDKKLVFFNYLQYSPLFYSNGQVIRGNDGEALVLENIEGLIKLLETNKSLLCLTKERYLQQFLDDKRLEVSFIAKQKDIQALRITLKQ